MGVKLGFSPGIVSRYFLSFSFNFSGANHHWYDEAYHIIVTIIIIIIIIITPSLLRIYY
jgi:hypothetical protein